MFYNSLLMTQIVNQFQNKSKWLIFFKSVLLGSKLRLNFAWLDETTETLGSISSWFCCRNDITLCQVTSTNAWQIKRPYQK